MDCKQFLAQFSEYLDKTAEPGTLEEMEAHRSTCSDCRRYAHTLQAGTDLLRSLPSPEVSPDFRPRLDHRIFHLEDGASIARQSMSSGATVISVLTVAVLVTASAWAPAFDSSDAVAELPALVVPEPETPSFPPTPVTPTFSRNRAILTTTEFQDGIWGNSHDLLREYSPILERRRDQALHRVGIE